MPSLRTHCAISLKRTGHDFRELHEWIDKPFREMGFNHRLERHAYNQADERKILEFWESKGRDWGQKAVVEWLFHIALDNISTSFKMAKKVYGDRAHNYFQFGCLMDSRYVFVHTSKERNVQQFFEEEFDDDDPDGVVMESVIKFAKKFLRNL